MMRAFFITMTVLSLVYMLVAAAMIEVVDDAYDDYYYYSYDSYSYDYDTYDYGSSYYDSYYYEEKAQTGTRLGGVFSLLYMTLAAVTFLMALLKIKTPAMKVISIIGLSLAGIFLLWSFMPIASPGSIGFDEVGGVFIVAAVAILGLDVVGIVQAFKTKT